MPAIVRESFELVNLPFTILIGWVVLYWGMVIFGLFDIEGLDGFFGVEMGASNPLGDFFFIGEIPGLIVASFLATALWAGAVLGNYYFNPGHTFGIALLIFVPNLIVSILLTRLIALPLRRVFSLLERSKDDDFRIIGQTCVVITQEVNAVFGQARIDVRNGAPVVINARTTSDEVLRKGDTAIIFERDEEKNICLVRKLESAKLG